MSKNVEHVVDRVLHWLSLSFDQMSSKFKDDPRAEDELFGDLNMGGFSLIPRTLILSRAGITEADCRSIELIGPLDDLNASNICRGPFDVKLTERPDEHLTFTRLRNQPTLRILDLSSIFHLYPLQRSGLFRYRTSALAGYSDITAKREYRASSWS